MDIVKYRLFAAVAFCLLILWFILLYTTNYYNSSFYINIKQLQYRPMKFTNELHNDTLANLDNFEFVMNNASLCIESTEIHSSVIVIMVHTARNNFDQRYAIRRTWGSVKVIRKWRLHLIFLLGSDSNSNPESYIETQTRLLDESIEYGDMIMGNFVDSYRNLTYKHLMGYKWVSAFCPTAQYILKTDDDIYADIFQVIDVLLVELMNSNKTYCCENMGGNKPIRVTNSKWYVPKELYPEDTYPDFCSGSAYLMKAADASKIYSVSNATDFFWIDDVFVTGVLREKYGTIVNNGSTTLEILSVFNRHHLGDKKEITKWCTKDLRTSQLNYTFILLNKNEFIRDMFCIWNKVRLMRHAMNVALA